MTVSSANKLKGHLLLQRQADGVTHTGKITGSTEESEATTG